MFIATMYSYGRDPVCVGVDGIVTCMGIFLVTSTQLFAIHIPATGSASEGINAFVGYVRNTEPGYDRRTARLYAVMNTDQRPDGVDLLRRCAQRLGVSQWEAVKVDLHLRTETGRLGAAIICRRDEGEIRLEYKVADDVVWQKDDPTTTRREGSYHTNCYDQVYSTNIGSAESWISINATNSTVEEPGGRWGCCPIL